MKLTGKIVSIGRHDRDGEAIDGVLIEVSREQLQQGGILYREVIVHTDHHAKIQNPEVLNVDLLERERDALAQKATALAVQVSEQTKRWDATIRENERLTRELDEARGRVKRLEGESESRWLLAQSAIGSCAEMSSRIKRLEEALEACAAIIGPRDKVTWATDEQVDHAWELYTKAKEATP